MCWVGLKILICHLVQVLVKVKVILSYTNDKTHLLTHDQQAATQDSTTSSGTQARYNNWV